MAYLPNLIFFILVVCSLGLFTRNLKRIRRNINLGKDLDRNDSPSIRMKNMFRVAFGQTKMVSRPIAGILHLIVYIGFVFINIELLEIVLDGLTGKHRLFAPYLGSFYNFLIAMFEVFALLVLIAVFFFWTRRNVIKIKRFWKDEMKGWPKQDADYILYFEVVLMILFLSMNSTDSLLQDLGATDYIKAGSFPVSQFLTPLFDSFELETLIFLERTFWWLHITGIFIFLNYLYYSKHLHILLAFPNTYFANLEIKGKFKVNPQIKTEVQLMLEPQAVIPEASPTTPDKFGVSDVFDLSWVQLMNSYSCTECGRCSS